MSSSILTDLKDFIGGATKDTKVFDAQIISFANMGFDKLRQIGVPCKENFVLRTKEQKWEDFFEGKEIESAKTWIQMHTRLLFDPPTSSYVQDSYKTQLSETEWRIYAEVDFPEIADEKESVTDGDSTSDDQNIGGRQ